jgi:hypothetical protein
MGYIHVLKGKRKCNIYLGYLHQFSSSDHKGLQMLLLAFTQQHLVHPAGILPKAACQGTEPLEQQLMLGQVTCQRPVTSTH